MGEYYQRDFKGGLDLYSKDTDVAINGYVQLINARTRRGAVESINKSLDITYNLNGSFQGLYGVGSVWIAFCAGNAFYMPVGGTQWFQVPFFSMDADVDYIYAQAVPGATNNFLRQAVLTQQVNDDGTVSNIVNSAGGIIKTTPLSVQGLPGGIVVQDGSNQPWLLTYDVDNNNVTARVLGNYSQWDNTGTTSNNMEYVPIGRQMMFLNGILFIQAPNGYTVYRSVSGSPLNFMVNVDQNGNKQPTEDLGGASTVSFAMDFDTITCLVPFASSIPDSFILATALNTYCLNLDFNTTIFGEPTFDKQFQLQVGMVNQFCITDSNGDTPIIDFNGVKLFNSVQQLKFRGNNDPRSKNISQLLQGITQNIACCTSFDNCNLFSLNTTQGYLVAVYDNIQQLWVSVDVNESTISGIKMYAQATLPGEQFLACGTQNGRVFLVYGDANDDPSISRECAYLISRAFVSGDYNAYGNFVPGPLTNRHRTNFVKVTVYTPTVDDNFTIQEYVDYERGQILSQPVPAIISGINYPIRPPVMANSKKRTQDIAFTLNQGQDGYKLQYILSWQSDLRLERFDVNSADINKLLAQDQINIASPV